MAFFPTSDISSWPQIALGLDARLAAAINRRISETLQAADDDVGTLTRLAHDQLATDQRFSDAIVNAVKTLDAAGKTTISMGDTHG